MSLVQLLVGTEVVANGESADCFKAIILAARMLLDSTVND